MVRRARTPGGPSGTEGKQVWARRPFRYTGDIAVARGQVFSLIGHKVDEKLIRLGYVENVTRAHRLWQAPDGGPKFVSEEARDGYQRELIRAQRRAGKPEDPREEDRRTDAEERKLQEVAPLRIGGE